MTISQHKRKTNRRLAREYRKRNWSINQIAGALDISPITVRTYTAGLK
jgi:hypothetical protein